MNCKPMQRKCLQQLASCSICRSSVVSATGSSPLACSSASWDDDTNERKRQDFFPLSSQAFVAFFFPLFFVQLVGACAILFATCCIVLFESMHMHMRGVTDWAWRRPRVLLFGHEILPSIGASQWSNIHSYGRHVLAKLQQKPSINSSGREK